MCVCVCVCVPAGLVYGRGLPRPGAAPNSGCPWRNFKFNGLSGPGTRRPLLMLVVAAWATKTGPRVHGIASGQRGPPPGQVTQLTNGATVTGAGRVVKLRATRRWRRWNFA